MKTSDDAKNLQTLTEGLTNYVQTYLARRLGIAAGAGLQLRWLESEPLGHENCALCWASVQVTEGGVHILFDGDCECGSVCQACAAGGPAGAAQRALKHGDEIVKVGWHFQDLARRLAEGVPRWEYGSARSESERGARNSRVEDAERDALRTKFATCVRTLKQASN